MSARGFAAGVAVLALLLSTATGQRRRQIHRWHAMQSELKGLLESSPPTSTRPSPSRVVPTNKGLYNETLSAVSWRCARASSRRSSRW